jgi:hypothetical protein
MAEISRDGSRIILRLSPDARRDVLLAAATAEQAADELENLAGLAALAGEPPADRGPSVEVFAAMDRGKPLVRWVLGRPAPEVSMSPARAVALAGQTRLAAADASRRARWLELRDPAQLVR